ncbi:MAG: PQQ-dependent sugar dehydrogenase, partial [Planctomycetota bacterium]
GGNGQNIESKLGKMIRIDVDGTDGPGGLYGIPVDNPYVGVAGLDEIYAIGFRNPFRFSFDFGLITDTLYVADVGQFIYEEVDTVVNGGNYGWAIREGAHCFVPPPPCTPLPGCGDPGLSDPISEYTHAEGGTAVIGGYVYRGSAYPQLVGKYVYGDFASDFFVPSGRLYYFDLTGPEAFVRKEFFLAPSGAPFGQFLKGFGRDADGEIYVAASDVLGPSGTTGVIYKIVPPPANDIVWEPADLTNPVNKVCRAGTNAANLGKNCATDAECPPGTAGLCAPGWPNNNPNATTRSLRFTVTGDPLPEKADAIRVCMVDLQNPVPPNAGQFPPTNFSGYETGSCAPKVCVGGAKSGAVCQVSADCPASVTPPLPAGVCTALVEDGCCRWVGPWGTFLEVQVPASGPYLAARLQCTPYYWDWKSKGPIWVVGAEIMPSSQYSVQTYGASCMGSEATCTNVSAPVTMYTRRSGDVEAVYNPPGTTAQPDAIDLAQVVNKFKNVVGAPVKGRAQLQPNLPELNADINALDIVAAVDAGKGLAYPFAGPCPCPSLMTCGSLAPPAGTPCASTAVCVALSALSGGGAGAMCVKTCVGG